MHGVLCGDASDENSHEYRHTYAQHSNGVNGSELLGGRLVSDVVEKHRLVVEVESLASSWKKITTRRREGVDVVVEKV